jgi:hypothetical protein
MRRPERDAKLRAALRSHAKTDAVCDVDSVARRIKRSAGSELLRMRYRPRSAADYISQWCAVLMPVGCICAIWGIVALARPAATEAQPRATLINAATNRISTPELVDILLTPPE